MPTITAQQLRDAIRVAANEKYGAAGWSSVSLVYILTGAAGSEVVTVVNTAPTSSPSA